MKASPFLEQLFHLAANLLEDHGHQDIANQIREQFTVPEWVADNNPLFKKGLVKIIKDYVKANDKILKYYQNRTQPQSEDPPKKKKKNREEVKVNSESPRQKLRSSSPKINHHLPSPVVAKIASPKQNGKSSWMNKFEKPKRLQDILIVKQAEEIPEVKPSKESKSKSKKQSKRVEIQSSQYQSQQDSFELEPKKKIKREVKQQKIKIKEVEKEKKKKVKAVVESIEQQPEQQVKKQEQPKIVPYQTYKPNNNYSDGPKKFFSRINVEEIGQIRSELKDNSFQAKERYGQEADHWGQFGYDKLKDTRGESFKKTKGKLKNRAFQGAMMDINKINSIPIA